MQEFFEWFRWLYDASGINLTIFYDSFDRNRFYKGNAVRFGTRAHAWRPGDATPAGASATAAAE